MISVGDTLPEATFLRMGEAGPEPVPFAPLLAGRKVVIFGLPGAFTSTCTATHLPSFMRTAEAFAAQGVGDIYCIAVNDPFVMKAWDQATGASGAGVTLLSDADAAFTKAIGLAFSAPPAGFYDRAQRYAMVVVDGKVTVLQTEEKPGECSLTVGETLLEAM